MSSQKKTCKSCHVAKNQEEFVNEKGVILSKCLQCRSNIKNSRLKKNEKQPDIIISYLDITEAVYSSLISLKNVNELYEGENEELNLILNIELSSFHDAILEENESNKENLEAEIGQHIITFISEDGGYSWVKNQNKDSFNIIYYCNCRIELGKRQAKHPELDKQRDMLPYLE